MDYVYLDNAATTKPDEEILRSALEETKELYFNPSALYKGGMAAKKLIEKARCDISSLFGGKKVIFTSCGSESDNTAIFSFYKRGNAVFGEGEHSAVFNCCNLLKQKGCDVRLAKLRYGGAVDVDDLLSKIDEKTTFVSVGHVNNETGAVNDIDEIAAAVRRKAPDAIFHSDGVQGFGKIPASLKNVDLYSVSAHKINGLKGTGALIFNERLLFSPLILGGGQEFGLRSGTENVLGIRVFAECAKKKYDKINENYERVSALRADFIDGLDKSLFRIISPENCSPYIVSFSAVGLRGQVVQAMADDEGVIIGTGSACSSKKPHSRIISAFEKNGKVLDGMLRAGFSPETTAEDILKAVKVLNAVTARLSGKINVR